MKIPEKLFRFLLALLKIYNYIIHIDSLLLFFHHKNKEKVTKKELLWF